MLLTASEYLVMAAKHSESYRAFKGEFPVNSRLVPGSILGPNDTKQALDADCRHQKATK
jgi:hypothetical protein